MALHILKDELLQAFIAKPQRLLLYGIQIIDPNYGKREGFVLLLQVLLGVLLDPLHEGLALLLAVG